MIRIINGKKYNTVNLECDAPPTNKGCGVQEYDESDDNGFKRRSPCKYKPTKDEIYHLYWKKGFSFREMELRSEKYFGEKISSWRFLRLMREYDIKRRPSKGGRKPKNN